MKPSTKEADLLFEQHTIAEITDIEKHLKADIEKKKVDLRQLVGERYRDLLEAADTITEMKNTASMLVERVTSLKSGQRTFQAQISAPCPEEETKIDQKAISVAEQVKFVIDAPTQMWSSMDQGRYLSAVLTFLVARHVHSSLRLDPQLYARFPLLASYWTLASTIQPRLLQAIKTSLESESCSYQDARDSLTGLFLLESHTLSSIFQEFLSIRQRSAQKILQSDKPGVLVKDQLCQFIQLVLNTIGVTHHVFSPWAGQCCLASHLHALLTSRDLALRVLPLNVPPCPLEGFLPQLSSSMETFASEEQLTQQTLDFLLQLGQTCKDSVVRLLHFLTSCRALASVREAVLEVQAAGDKSTQLYHRLQLDLWESFLLPAFLDCYQSLISQTLKALLQAMLRTIEATWRNSVDMAQFVWSPPDEPRSKSSANHPPLILKLCEAAESKMRDLLEDMDSLPAGLVPQVSDHLRAECSHLLARLIEHCKSNRDPQWSLFSYKLSLAVPQLCPSLIQSHFHKVEDPSCLQTVADEFFRQWIEDVLARLLKQLQLDLDSSSPALVLANMQTWEKVEIQEESEEGQSLKSTIRVPLQVSIPLQTLLFRLVMDINSAGGHTFLRRALHTVSQQLAQGLAQAYSDLSWPSTPPRLGQTVAVQAWFDLKFCGQLLGCSPQLTPAMALVESHIDPFDLDVLLSPLGINLRLALHRSTLLLGLISPNSSLTGASAPPRQSEVPSLVALSTSTTPRFPLLPAPSTSRQSKTHTTISGSGGSASLLRGHNSSPDLGALPQSSPVKTSTSFYDRMTSAMATNWFS